MFLMFQFIVIILGQLVITPILLEKIGQFWDYISKDGSRFSVFNFTKNQATNRILYYGIGEALPWFIVVNLLAGLGLLLYSIVAIVVGIYAYKRLYIDNDSIVTSFFIIELPKNDKD